MSEPFVEVTTKFEKFDRNIGRDEALEISNITEDEYEAIVKAALEVDVIIEQEAAKNARSQNYLLMTGLSTLQRLMTTICQPHQRAARLLSVRRCLILRQAGLSCRRQNY